MEILVLGIFVRIIWQISWKTIHIKPRLVDDLVRYIKAAPVASFLHGE